MADLVLENVQKLFGKEGVGGVHDVSLQIPRGESFVLLGPSGCGKTTTLRLIGGFESPSSGKILYDNKDLTPLPPHKRPIRTVFQRYALFPHLSVYENIVFGLRMQKMPEKIVRPKAERMLDMVQVQHLLKQPVTRLSGGEQQRVALARALITEPEVLLLDEPLSALDLKLREKMQLELLELKKEFGSTFIFVTHDQSEAMLLGDRIGVMRRGYLEQVGSPEELYLRPATNFVASFIGQANFLEEAEAQFFKGDLGKLPALKKGQKWMLRPENLMPVRGELPKDSVSFPCTLENSVYLGQERLAKLSSPCGARVLVKSPGHEPPLGKEGQELQLYWELEDTWVVDSETA